MRREYVIGSGVCASPKGTCQVMPTWNSSSLLNHTFNNLLCAAINMYESGVPLTHLAFLHDDVAPDAAWVDTLVAEMARVDVDFISAYSPIKDDRGLTSMAVYRDDQWDFQRHTMRELADMPETFTDADVDGNLMLNTGCCLLKLRDPWLSNPDEFVFHTQEKIDRGSDGKWIASVLSEDWLFTDAIRKVGGRLAATRKVALAHEGTHDYHNNSIWGRWKRDEAYFKRHENDHQCSEREDVLCVSSS